jgi:SAM-dependent methyltransferase
MVYRLASAAWHRSPAWLQSVVRYTPALHAIKAAVRGFAPDHAKYGAAWYQEIDRDAARSAPVMADSIAQIFRPATVLDVGCGSGALLDALRARGVNGTGLEYSPEGLALCRQRDIRAYRFDLTSDTLPAELAAQFDLVICIEVAEHIPERFADRLVELITSRSDTTLFTAATPGQGGYYHVNEQPHAYWVEKFATRGYQFDMADSLRWRAEWETHVASGVMAWWYPRNVMLFHRAR